MKKLIINPAVDSFAGLVTAVAALDPRHPIIALTTAAFIPIFSDIYKRMLSPTELSRIERAESIALKQIFAHIERGSVVREELTNVDGIQNMNEILEGSLIVSKNSYEDKKIPLIANLISTAPFTNTPLKNLIHTLQLAESLSYRKLCIIRVFAWREYGLSSEIRLLPVHSRNLNLFGDEEFQGVYNDILQLIKDDILAQVNGNVKEIVGTIGDVIPSHIIPLYNGTLLINGLALESIPAEDMEDVYKFFKAEEDVTY